MKRLAVFIAFLLVTGVFLGIWLRDGEQAVPEGEATDSLASAQPGSSALDGTTPTSADQQETQDQARREPVAGMLTASLIGFVQSTSQEAIPGADVHLTVLTAEDTEWEGAWHGDDWGPLERGSLQTRSDPAGRFEFSDLPETSHGAVLWAGHPDYQASVVLLGERREDWPRQVRVSLAPAATINVVVLDDAGSPAVGAVVEQFGSTPDGAALGAGGVSDERARRLLHRSGITGPDGTVRLGSFPGEQVLVATRGPERSVPWKGTSRSRVVLTLFPTFSVGGEVAMPSWGHLNYVGERRITVAAQSRNLWRTLCTLRSVDEGEWGPVVLPLLEVDRYRVRLEGSPIIPVEAFFEPPARGAELDVDLRTEIGVNLWLRVADEEDRVIPEAVVKVLWQEPGRPDHWNFVERRCNQSGQINVWSVPPGFVTFEASAEGYVPVRTGLEPTSLYEDGYAPINLTKAGRLRGKCLHEGQPLREFEVLVWQPAHGNNPTSTPFFDREDGSFELHTVPEGDFWVTASSPEYPGGEPLEVHCPPGGTVEVLLELPSGLVGRGMVVDERTNDPLPEASIQMFVKGGVVPVARWGLPHPVGSDGAFELRGFVPGENYVRAAAPGYSNRAVKKTVAAEEELDWGVIALSRTQSLEILLERSDATNDVVVSGKGAQVLPARTLPADGVVVYEDVSSGQYSIRFEEESGTGTAVEVRLSPGERWTLRERIDGPNHLTVEVRAEDASGVRDLSRIEASYVSPQGFRHRRFLQPENGIAEFHGIDAQTVSVSVEDGLGEVAARSGTFVDGRLHMVVPIGGEPFDLRVVDADGNPVPDVRVVLMDPETPGLALFGGTDRTGECELIGVPPRQVLIHLQHGSRGSHFGIRCDASSGAAELVLDAQARLELLFLDGSTALGGVSCAIVDHMGSVLASEAAADEAGLAVLPALAADTYSLAAWRSDCWPTRFSAEARVDGEPTRVQIRRLGNLDLRVTTANGLPVSDLAIDLTSLEFGAEVAGWIAQGRVRSEGLVTDPRGRILVERLPHGAYLWRIALPGREPLEGEVVVEPGDGEPIRLALPE